MNVSSKSQDKTHFSNIQLTRTRVTVDVFSIITAAVAFSAGLSIYLLVKPTLYILLAAIAETVLFVGIVMLNRLGHHHTATISFFIVQNLAVLYYGLILEPSAGVHLMSIFVAGVSILLFPGKAKYVAFGGVALVFTTLIYNYTNRFIPAVIPGNPDNLLSFIIYPVMFLHIAYLFRLHEKNYATYIEKEKIQSHELFMKTIELENKGAELEKLNNFKSAYIRENSHELRSPINAIFLITDMLSMPSQMIKGQPTPEVLYDLQAACQIVKSIINNVLELNKIEQGVQARIVDEPVDIRYLVRDIADLYQHMANTRNILIDVSFCEDVPFSILIDRLKITQVLINLLTNAIKYSRSNTSVYFAVFINDDDEIVFSIEDEGDGIADDMLPKIFDLHVTDNPGDGNGIGLYITKRLTEQMSGRIDLCSEQGEGSSFMVSFPLKEVEPNPVELHLDIIFDGAGLRALVIEDDHMNQKYLGRLLKIMHFDVIAAATGHEGIYRAASEPIDVIFLDAFLPDLHAPDIIAALVKRQINTPIIITSGDQYSLLFSKLNAQQQELLNLAQDYLLKPYNSVDLSHSLTKLFGKHSAVPLS